MVVAMVTEQSNVIMSRWPDGINIFRFENIQLCNKQTIYETNVIVHYSSITYNLRFNVLSWREKEILFTEYSRPEASLHHDNTTNIRVLYDDDAEDGELLLGNFQSTIWGFSAQN